MLRQGICLQWQRPSASIVRAASTISVYDLNLLHKGGKIDTLDGSDVSSALSALSRTTQGADKTLWDSLFARAVQTCANLDLLEISAILNVAVGQKHYPQSFRRGIFGAAKKQMSSSSPQSVVKILCSLAQFPRPDGSLVTLACAEAERHLAKFEPMDISLTLQALARLHRRKDPLIRALCEAALRRAKEFQDKEAAIALAALPPLKIKNPTLLAALASSPLLSQPPELNEAQLISLLDSPVMLRAHQLSRLLFDYAVKEKQLPPKLLPRIAETVHSWKGQDLSRAIQACSRLQLVDSGFWVALFSRAYVTSNEFSVPEICGVLKVAIQRKQIPLMEKILSEMSGKIDSVDEKSIPQLLRALSKLQEPDPDLVQALCGKCQMKGSLFTPQGISMSLAALLDLGQVGPAFKDLCSEALQQANRFNEVEIATTLNALAKVTDADLQLVAALCTTGRTCAGFRWKNAMHVLVALGKLSFQDPIIDKMAKILLAHVNEFNAIEISIVLNALAQVGTTEGTEALLSRLEEEVERKVSGFQSQVLANVISALSKFPSCKRSLFSKLGQEVQKKIETFALQELLMVFSAMARAGLSDKVVQDRVLAKLSDQVSNFNGQELAFFFNSLTKLGPLDHALVAEVTRNALKKSSEFSPQHIGLLFNGLAKFEMYDLPLIAALSTQIRRRSVDFDCQAVANTLHALAKLRVDDPQLVLQLCIARKPSEFDLQGIVDTLYSLASLGVYHESFVPGLFQQVRTRATEFTAVHASVILTAMAKLDLFDQSLAEQLFDVIFQTASELNSQYIANVFQALAKFGARRSKLLPVLQELTQKKIAQFNSQEIANVMNALAKLEVYNKSLLHTLSQEILRKAEHFTPPDIAITLNALVRFNLFDAPLVDRLAMEALRKAPLFDAHAISSTLNALSRFGFFDVSLVTKLCTESLHKTGSFTSQGIANTLSALANFEVKDSALISQLCLATRTKLAELNSHEIAGILDALDKLDTQDDDLVLQLCAEILKKVSTFNPQDIAVTLHALANYRIFNEEIVSLLQKEALRQVQAFNAQGITLTLSALAQYNMCDRELLKLLCEEAYRKAATFEGQGAASMLHSLAVLGHDDEQLYHVFRSRLESLDVAYISQELQGQAGLCRLWVSLTHPTWLPLRTFPRTPRPAKRSFLQEQVGDALKSLGIPHKHEYDVDGLVVDIVLLERKIALEVDGPSHYFRNVQRIDGSTQLRNRLLQRMGWRVKSVPYFQFQDLTPAGKQIYLTDLLEAP